MLDKTGESPQRASARTSQAALSNLRRSCGCFSGPWFVAETSGRIFPVEYALEAGGWRTFLPLHLHRVPKKADRIAPLFPGYIFILIPADQAWQRVVSSPGVVRLLGSGDQPRPVPDAAVADLRARMSDRRIVDDPLSTPAAYPAGTPLLVADGPLAGLRGVCKLGTGARVRVLLSLLGRDVEMELAARSVMRG